MALNFKQFLNELIIFLDEEDTEQKKRYYSAIDIEDMDEATAVTLDARGKIQQLRKWIEDLHRINSEIESSWMACKMTAQLLDAEDREEIDLTQYVTLFSSENTDRRADKLEGDDVTKLEPGKIEQEDNEIADAQTTMLPGGFYLFEKYYEMEDWKDVIGIICETMILKKPYKMAHLGIKEQYMLSGNPILSLEEQQVQAGKKLSNGFYVETSGDANDLRMRCEYILSECGFDSDVLQIR